MIRIGLHYHHISLVLAVLLMACTNQPFSRDSNSYSAISQAQLLDDNAVVATSGAEKKSEPAVGYSEGLEDVSGLTSLLINEFAAVRNPDLIQINKCFEWSQANSDERLAERCYELSVRDRDTSVAVEAARNWVSVAPESEIAQQQLGRALIADKLYGQALDALLAAKAKGMNVDVTSPALNSVFLYGEELVEIIDKYRQKRKEFPRDEQLLLGEVILQTRLSEQNYYIGNYQEAVTSLNDLIALDNNLELDSEEVHFERPYLFRARSLQQLNRSHEAISSLERAIKKHPNYIALRLELTDLYLQKNNYKKAEQTVLSLLGEKVTSDVYYEVGKVIAGSPLSQAVAVVRERLLQDSDNDKLPVARNELALLRLSVLAELADDKASKKRYLEKINETPELVITATSEIASMLSDESGENAGEEHFYQARKRWPNIYDELWQAQAQWLARTNRKKAIELLNQIIAVNPSEGLVFARGLYYSLDGNIEKMERDFQSILGKNPEHVDALNAYGYTLVDQTDRIEEGAEMIARAFSLQSERPAIVDSLGWAYYRQGKLKQALVLIHWAYSRLQDAEIGSHYGEILWALGHREQARLLLDQELRREPNNEVLKDTFERLFDSEKQ